MVPPFKTPGVYTEEISKSLPRIERVATAIPAFIGYTQQAQKQVAGDLHLRPTRLVSLREYAQYFGGPQPETRLVVTITERREGAGHQLSQRAGATLAAADRSRHILYYALQLYFANGGGPCYIVSVGPYKALGTALVASELLAGLAQAGTADEPTLLVLPEAQALEALADSKAVHDAALAQCARLRDRFALLDVPGLLASASSAAGLRAAVEAFWAAGVGPANLQYGAAYAPNLETTLDYLVDDALTDVRYVLDTNAPVVTKLAALAGPNPQRYALARAAMQDLPCPLPPSAAIAGIYATVDAARGVWKAPANVALSCVSKPTVLLTNAEQDYLSGDAAGGKSVNAIRAFAGKGTLVWGARTLAGNEPEWQYINVRRLFIFVEESVVKGARQLGSKPNNAATWAQLRRLIEDFLATLWRQGALPGTKPEQAFYVAVGLGQTMTPLDLAAGRLVVEIGLAAVRPAEFTILKISLRAASS